MKISRFQLHAATPAHRFENKAAFAMVPDPPGSKERPASGVAAAAPAPETPVAAESIVDLTARVDAAGKLSWDAPPARWIVQRIGHTSTGQMNRPSPAAGLSLECDKFSAEALRRHFDAFIARLADDAGPAVGRSFDLTHIDSWEVSVQNWTPRMAEEFARRRGYDLTPWLVSLAGGRITLPGGMSYRVMQLPEDQAMTPELLRQIRDLVRAGAVVEGPRPESSPSLQNYPQCDAVVKSLAAGLWRDCDGRAVTEHALGAGRVYWGRPLAEVLRTAAGGPDVRCSIGPAVTDDSIRSVTLGRGKTMGDEPPDLMPTKGPEWFIKRLQRPELRRLTFTIWKYYTADAPLLASGLLGPVTQQTVRRLEIR